MLLKADVKQIEWRTAAFLSQDKKAIEEIKQGVDIHEVNRKALGLPTRLIAKIFLFRLIYGGSCWAYAKDSEFNFISKDSNYWQEVIDETYRKYNGLYEWHKKIVNETISTGEFILPTGRCYKFSPYKDKNGNLKWPITAIKNYPVQGLSADLMVIARISARKRLRKYEDKVLFINTVHDDIVLDCSPKVDVKEVASVLKGVFFDLPGNFSRIFLSKDKEGFNVPLEAEILIGENLLEMKELV